MLSNHFGWTCFHHGLRTMIFGTGTHLELCCWVLFLVATLLLHLFYVHLIIVFLHYQIYYIKFGKRPLIWFSCILIHVVLRFAHTVRLLGLAKLAISRLDIIMINILSGPLVQTHRFQIITARAKSNTLWTSLSLVYLCGYLQYLLVEFW